MRADGVGVVDEAVVDAVARLHLVLHGVDHVTFADDVMGQVDAGQLAKRGSEHFAFIHVRGQAFGYGLYIHTAEGFGSLGEPQ